MLTDDVTYECKVNKSQSQFTVRFVAPELRIQEQYSVYHFLAPPNEGVIIKQVEIKLQTLYHIRNVQGCQVPAQLFLKNYTKRPKTKLKKFGH